MTPNLPSLESRRIVCIRLRNWPIDRMCRRRQALRLNPLALIETAAANRRFVAAACERARSLGVRPGIDQAEAMAVCPSLVCLPHDPVADARGLKSLGRWMMRFTPIVSIANGPEDPLGTPDALLLDVTGCERVFRGINELIRQGVESIKRFRLDAQIAIGPNPGAAWAMTFTRPVAATPASPHVPVLSLARGDAGVAATASVPCEALRLDDDTLAKLQHLGIRTIGQLLAIPREQLPARFGKLLTLRIDQLLGNVPEPLVPLEPPAVVSARMDFDGVVTSLEAIWVVFRELLGRVITQLTRRGRGVRELEVTFVRAYASPLLKTIGLSRPSRDPVNLFNLFRCATEQLEDRNSSNDEFLGMRLLVRVHEPLPDEQIGLLDEENYAGEMELDRLIERLCARLGEQAIARVESVESYIPERCYRIRSRRGEPCVRPSHPSQRTRRANTRFAPTPDHAGLQRRVRPLHLLSRPLEVRVTVNPFNDSFGQPMQFVEPAGGDVHRLPHVVGPERISGQWWDGHNKTRDYFDVEDESGQRFWLFRVNETLRWYLHGQYA